MYYLKSVHEQSAGMCSPNYKKLHFSSFSAVFAGTETPVYKEKRSKSVHA
jgi:hypothetical protein